MYEVFYLLWKWHSCVSTSHFACQNHTHACASHTWACKNPTLRAKITIVRVEITLERMFWKNVRPLVKFVWKSTRMRVACELHSQMYHFHTFACRFLRFDTNFFTVYVNQMFYLGCRWWIPLFVSRIIEIMI
jgi:hypothetical protein